MGHRDQKTDLGLMGQVLGKHFLERKFEWGANDCCSAPSNVLKDLGRPELRDYLDNLYHDKESALRVISDAGGFEALVEQIAVDLNATRTHTPKALSIGVLCHGDTFVLSIHDGTQFWGKGMRSAVFSKLYVSAFNLN
jgi:hypothetical protein